MNNITTTLEQSKRLEELGFNQNTYFGYWNEKIVTRTDFKGYAPIPDMGEWCAAPTLSEIIEWLGDDFDELDHLIGGSYDAIGTIPDYYFDNEDRHGAFQVVKRGATPLGAVFNLCEAIHGGKESTND